MSTAANAKKTENIRIRSTSYQKVRALAQRTQQSALDVLDQAVETYRRQLLFDEADAKYAALQRDPQVWKEILEEQELWDSTLLDGLEPEEGGRSSP
jgi:hypothetical protein